MKKCMRPNATGAIPRGFAAAVLAGLLVLPVTAQAQDSHDMRLVGVDDLQARSAYQPIVQAHQDGRWIAYIGHHNGSAFNPLTLADETNGVSIVDVSDPGNPVYLHHIPGVAGAQMVRTCSGDELPEGVPGSMYLLRSNGNLEHQVFDVTDPSAPVLVSTPVTGLVGTHKSWWECDSGIAYLVSGVPGWRTNRMTQIFDLSDPADPVHIRDFGLVGQEPGSKGPVPISLHGCIPVPDRNRVYCGHGTNSNGIFVIYDRQKLINGDPDSKKPFRLTPENLLFPQVSRLDTPSFMGAHSTFPILDVEVTELAKDQLNPVRDMVALVNESLRNECSQNEPDNRKEGRQRVHFVDITDETKPFSVSTFDVPEADGDFCEVGGRFGSHASNESFTSTFYRKLLFVSWFNAGVRVIDMRDPFNPVEAAYFIPATTAKTDDRAGKIAIQTNNVEVDDRGLVYTTDRANTGLHILELIGNAQKIADGVE